MTYEWENKVTPQIMAEIQAVLERYGNLELFGVAVANPETGEGALLPRQNADGSVYDADVSRDVASDAEFIYSSAVIAMRAAFETQERKH